MYLAHIVGATMKVANLFLNILWLISMYFLNPFSIFIINKLLLHFVLHVWIHSFHPTTSWQGRKSGENVTDFFECFQISAEKAEAVEFSKNVLVNVFYLLICFHIVFWWNSYLFSFGTHRVHCAVAMQSGSLQARCPSVCVLNVKEI